MQYTKGMAWETEGEINLFGLNFSPILMTDKGYMQLNDYKKQFKYLNLKIFLTSIRKWKIYIQAPISLEKM